MTLRRMMGALGISLLGGQACSAGDAGEVGTGGVSEGGELDTVAQDLIVRPRPTPPIAPLPLPPNPDAPMCGGIAGIECPGNGRCVDDPYDDCDPTRGGADCSGLCVCVPRIDKLRPPPGTPPDPMCGRGRRFDPSPEVCACVPSEPDPCATVLCARGTICVATGLKPECVPIPVVE